MNVKLTRRLLVLAIGCLVQSVALAGQIVYELSSLGGSKWRYDYALDNLSGSNSISEFTIYFNRNNFSNLSLRSSAVGWDSVVVQPDLALASDGFLDALVNGIPLQPGNKATGFSVSFDFINATRPSDQQFEFINPTTFATLFSGSTTIFVAPPPPNPTPPSNPVPSPSSFSLLLLVSLVPITNLIVGCKYRTRRKRSSTFLLKAP
jgi:hypothetical protein